MASLILIHRRRKWSPRRGCPRSQPESTVGPGWTVAGGASSLCLLRVMPKTQPLRSVLNRSSETEVDEVEKKSFNALPGKGDRSEFLSLKTMLPHPGGYDEKFYSQGSSGRGMADKIRGCAGPALLLSGLRSPSSWASLVLLILPFVVSWLLLLFSLEVMSNFLFPVLHYLPEFAQTHVHWVSDAIQPSHPQSPPFLLALDFSQHQGLFQ